MIYMYIYLSLSIYIYIYIYICTHTCALSAEARSQDVSQSNSDVVVRLLLSLILFFIIITITVTIIVCFIIACRRREAAGQRESVPDLITRVPPLCRWASLDCNKKVSQSNLQAPSARSHPLRQPARSDNGYNPRIYE